MTRAAIGLGGNVGDVPATLRRAVAALSALGSVVAVSSLYRSRPWGRREQADFWNAVVLLSTPLEAPVLLARLKQIELQLGRTPSVRWGPRALDLDILTYGSVRLATPGLEIPHPRLLERAFALAPLAEVDARFREFFEALPPAERESVTLAGPFQPVGETQPLMPLRSSQDDASQEPSVASARLAERIHALAQVFVLTDLIRLRIEDDNDDAVELRKAFGGPPSFVESKDGTVEMEPVVRLEPIKADLVGIFRFSRPLPFEGLVVTADRELAYVEALGIRTPVRSLGPGRVASVKIDDGQPVEYGQVLFEMDRS